MGLQNKTLGNLSPFVSVSTIRKNLQNFQTLLGISWLHFLIFIFNIFFIPKSKRVLLNVNFLSIVYQKGISFISDIWG